MTDADSLTTELDDSDDDRAGYDWGRLELSRLLQANALRRLIGSGVANAPGVARHGSSEIQDQIGRCVASAGLSVGSVGE